MNDVTHEVEIEIVGDEFRCRFGVISSAPRWVGGHPTFPLAPIIMVMTNEVAAALQPGGDEAFPGVLATATPDGFFRVDSASGSWVWELFPARWWDGGGPDIYLAVWRD